MPSFISVMIFVLLSISCSHAYKYYQDKIPNGHRVIHSCKQSVFWNGVGHKADSGGGALNKFGKEFKAAAYQWTKEVCQKDSDGDGKTNGEELGDPDCVWKEGDTPSRISDLTNPGVCEPIDSEKCKPKNDWDLCKNINYHCPGFEKPNVWNFTIRFRRTNVPKKITSYFCQAFEMPTNGTFHMIGTSPAIDNAYVMHHILAFGCTSKPSDSLFDKPEECGMGGAGCSIVVAGWTLGDNGDCFKEFGVPLGVSGKKWLVLQYHWNNPTLRTDYYDGSGLVLHLTPTLRPNHGALMMLGQRYLELAPGQPNLVQPFACDSKCTKEKLKSTRFVSFAVLHMHGAGITGHVGIYRDGKLIYDIIPNGTQISYDAPERFYFDPPIKWEPGDAVRIDCYFNTMKYKDYIYWGDATADEMCFLFFGYYPETEFKSCIGFGPVDLCTSLMPKYGGTGISPGKIDDCNLVVFMMITIPAWEKKVNELCSLEIDGCRTSCRMLVKEFLKDPCMAGWARKFLNFASSFDHKPSVSFRSIRLQIKACEEVLRREAEMIAQQNHALSQTTAAPATSTTETEFPLTTVLIASVAVVGGGLLAAIAAIIAMRMLNPPVTKPQLTKVQPADMSKLHDKQSKGPEKSTPNSDRRQQRNERRNANERQGNDRCGNERQANDRYGNERQGNDRYGNERQGNDRYGNERQGNDRYGNERQGNDRYGNERQGNDRYGNERQGNDRYGDERLGNDRYSNYPSQRMYV